MVAVDIDAIVECGRAIMGISGQRHISTESKLLQLDNVAVRIHQIYNIIDHHQLFLDFIRRRRSRDRSICRRRFPIGAPMLLTLCPKDFEILRLKSVWVTLVTFLGHVKFGHVIIQFASSDFL